jgi:hypothetical protein
MFRDRTLVVLNSIFVALGSLVTLLCVAAVFSAPRPDMTSADYNQWAQLKFANALPEIVIATTVVFLFNFLCWIKLSGEVETIRAWEWALRPALGWSLTHFVFWCASAALGAFSLYQSKPPYQGIFP